MYLSNFLLIYRVRCKTEKHCGPYVSAPDGLCYCPDGSGPILPNVTSVSAEGRPDHLVLGHYCSNNMMVMDPHKTVSMNGSAQVVIVVGALVLAGIVVWLGWFFDRKRVKARRGNKNSTKSDQVKI